jgi:hypothetical protein
VEASAALDVVDAMPAPRSTFKKCRSGRHPMTPDNVYVRPSGKRTCLECLKENRRASAVWHRDLPTWQGCDHPRVPANTIKFTDSRVAKGYVTRCAICRWDYKLRVGRCSPERAAHEIASIWSALGEVHADGVPRPGGRLAAAHPALAAYVATLEPKRQARIEKAYTLSQDEHHGVQAAGRRSYWELVARVSPEAFVRFVERADGSYAALGPVFIAMPDAMLELPAAPERASYTKVGDALVPRPSAFWPTIAATLDGAILRAGRHHDVELLGTLAQVPRANQPDFWKRAQTRDVTWARRLVAAPAWARIFIDGDQGEAAKMWRAVTSLVRTVTYIPGTDLRMAGRQVQWLAGELYDGDVARDHWRLAIWGIGHALEHGQATLEDFVYNQTGRNAPWTRW